MAEPPLMPRAENYTVKQPVVCLWTHHKQRMGDEGPFQDPSGRSCISSDTKTPKYNSKGSKANSLKHSAKGELSPTNSNRALTGEQQRLYSNVV